MTTLCKDLRYPSTVDDVDSVIGSRVSSIGSSVNSRLLQNKRRNNDYYYYYSDKRFLCKEKKSMIVILRRGSGSYNENSNVCEVDLLLGVFSDEARRNDFDDDFVPEAVSASAENQ